MGYRKDEEEYGKKKKSFIYLFILHSTMLLVNRTQTYNVVF